MMRKVKIALANSLRNAALAREQSWEVAETGQYALSVYGACTQVIKDKEEAEIVYMLLLVSWVDALEWSDSIIEKYNS
jgi:hypothetical protein